MACFTGGARLRNPGEAVFGSHGAVRPCNPSQVPSPFVNHCLGSGRCHRIVGHAVGVIALVELVSIALLGVAFVAARALATRIGEAFALKTALVVRGLSYALTPVLVAEAFLARRITRTKVDQPDSGLESSPVELNISIEGNGEPLDEREVRMIRGVVQQDKTTAREIMVPRVDMVAAERDTSLDQLVEKMVESGHSPGPDLRRQP